MSKPKQNYQAEQRTETRTDKFGKPVSQRCAEELRRALERAKSQQKGGDNA